MKRRNIFLICASSLGILILILDGKTALLGAQEGMKLCINTLIPSLFPFFLMSTLLTGAISGQTISCLRPLASICKIPRGTESLLLIGLLGGYPVGAQNVSLLYQQGKFSRAQAMRMIAFCNNAGPSFIFGVLSVMFTQGHTSWLLWIIHIISALLVGMILPASESSETVSISSKEIHITDALWQSIKVMAVVCGWVVLMKIILVFMQLWFLWLFPVPIQVFISGLLELSNGCMRLPEISCEGLRFIIVSALLALGGTCVTLQTSSVAGNIPMQLYFHGKVLQCCISVILACLVQVTFPAAMRFQNHRIIILPIVFIILAAAFLHKKKKSSSIQALIGV